MRGEFLLKGKLGTLSLACVLGLSTILFSGCGANDNNKVGAKYTGRGHLIVNNNGTYRPLGTRSTTLNGLNGTNRTYGTANGTNRTFNTGTNGIVGNGRSATGIFGNGANDRNGDGLFGRNGLFGANRTPGMGNYSAGGIAGGTSGYGRTGIGATGPNGLAGTNRNGTAGVGVGTRGTTGIGTYVTPGTRTGTSGIAGTGSTANGFRTMSATDSHILQLGALTIVGRVSGSSANRSGTTGGGTTGIIGQNWSGGTSHMTGTTGTRPAGSRFSGTGGVGTYSTGAGTNANGRTLVVTGQKAVNAIDRVNRALASPTTLSAKSATLAKDLSYILKQATRTSSGTR